MRCSKIDRQREWLYWYDRSGVRYPTASERAAMAEALSEQERRAKLEAEAIAEQASFSQRRAEAAGRILQGIAEQERNENEKLAAYLRSLGINPDDIP
jgi:hypothetical protein